MAENRLIELAKLLIEKAKTGKTNWHKTSRANEFRIEFTTGFLTVDIWTDAGERFVDVSLYNEAGDVIDFEQLDPSYGKDYEVMIELHSIARRAYYKTEETYKDIFEEIKAKDTIGNETPSKGNDEFDIDSLPF